MRAIILCGGFGTRLSEYTDTIPKPMVPIGNRPILWHIIQIYKRFGVKKFLIALGYKGEIIKEYFARKENIDPDIDFNLIDTGLGTMTGGRLKRLQNLIKNETFMMTYGDGLADINIKELMNFHKDHKKMVTITAVRPPARFGSLELDGSIVKRFKEKSRLHTGWINGGFFVFEPTFFNFLKNDEDVLESSPLETVAQNGEVRAFKHEGFWQCMDHKSDKDNLEQKIKKNNTPWLG